MLSLIDAFTLIIVSLIAGFFAFLILANDRYITFHLPHASIVFTPSTLFEQPGARVDFETTGHITVQTHQSNPNRIRIPRSRRRGQNRNLNAHLPEVAPEPQPDNWNTWGDNQATWGNADQWPEEQAVEAAIEAEAGPDTDI